MDNKVIIVTAPSGAGKTTIVKHLITGFSQLAFSVSATTRKQRPDETNGEDYYFISAEEFKNKIANNEFVEWQEVYSGTFYGTLKAEVEKLWAQNKVVIFDVDVKGAVNLKKKFGDKALSIFIKPPSEEELEKRLKNRATESPDKIEERISKAKEELQFEEYFDESVENDYLPEAQDEAAQLVLKFINN